MRRWRMGLFRNGESRWKGNDHSEFREAVPRACTEKNCGYASHMTQAVAHILQEVSLLSPPESVELRRAIVERIPMSDDLTDDDFAALGADLFRMLDEEEDARRGS
jgi:hypothetical protein